MIITLGLIRWCDPLAKFLPVTWTSLAYLMVLGLVDKKMAYFVVLEEAWVFSRNFSLDDSEATKFTYAYGQLYCGFFLKEVYQ